jgi:hypothetical protein
VTRICFAIEHSSRARKACDCRGSRSRVFIDTIRSKHRCPRKLALVGNLKYIYPTQLSVCTASPIQCTHEHLYYYKTRSPSTPPNRLPTLRIQLQRPSQLSHPRRLLLAGFRQANPLSHAPGHVFFRVADDQQCLLFSQTLHDSSSVNSSILRFLAVREEGQSSIAHRFVHPAESFVEDDQGRAVHDSSQEEGEALC